MIRWMARAAVAALVLMGGNLPAVAQNVFGVRPLTAYTLYPTGTSFAEFVTAGNRYGARAGGMLTLRVVAQHASAFINFGLTNLAANLSSFFLPVGETVLFQVPAGSYMAHITPYVISTVAAGRPTIFITELE